jgi:serine protease AprX
MRSIKGKLSLALERDLSAPVGLNNLRRVVIHAGCVTCKHHLMRRKISIIHHIPMMNAFVAEVPMRALPALASMGYIRHIEDDATVKISMDIARSTVYASMAQSEGLRGGGITIAAIDTGIFPHEDFVTPNDRIIFFLDLINGRTEPYDDNGHGTFCMGCAGGNGTASGGEFAGIAPQANLLMIKAMDEDGGGRISDILLAMQWVYDNVDTYNIKVLSMSLGIEPFMINPFRDSLAEAATTLWRRGIVVCAAAGNSGPAQGTINSPGTARSVITVGAVDDREPELKIARFSSRDREGGTKPDIIAPGVNIRSVAAKQGAYTNMSGTSMATPIVAGCAALLLENEPGLSPDEVKTRLLNSAISINEPENIQGKGVVSMKGVV